MIGKSGESKVLTWVVIVLVALFVLLVIVNLNGLRDSEEGFSENGSDTGSGEGSGSGVEFLSGPVQCCFSGVLGFPGAECFESGSAEECSLEGGAVQNCIPNDFLREVPGPPQDPENITQETNQSNPFVRNLTQSVARSNISSRVYNASSYDCDDFADDMERHLEGDGFNATYTLVVKYNSTGVRSSHALNDIHLPDGRIIYIEPQTGRVVNLDRDGDGSVGVRDNPGGYVWGRNVTEGNDTKITSYPDAGAANQSGAPRD